jgi:hypothetical protein
MTFTISYLVDQEASKYRPDERILEHQLGLRLGIGHQRNIRRRLESMSSDPAVCRHHRVPRLYQLYPNEHQSYTAEDSSVFSGCGSQTLGEMILRSGLRTRIHSDEEASQCVNAPDAVSLALQDTAAASEGLLLWEPNERRQRVALDS